MPDVMVWLGTCVDGADSLYWGMEDEPEVKEVDCPSHVLPVSGMPAHTVKLTRVGKAGCEFFSTCTRYATHLEPHSVLGVVPSCDRCPNIGA